MELTLHCRDCGGRTESVNVEPSTSETLRLNCANEHTVTAQLPQLLRVEGRWTLCPVCGARDAYLQKDVPKRLLLGILIVCLAGAFVLFFYNWWWGISLLLGLALLDWILFSKLRNVLVCYDCGTEARNVAQEETHRVFDPHKGESYRQRKRASS